MNTVKYNIIYRSTKYSIIVYITTENYPNKYAKFCIV